MAVICNHAWNGLEISYIFSSPESPAHKVSLKYTSQDVVCMCVCICVSTLSNMNISPTSGPIAIKYLKHHCIHWGGEKDVLGFGSGRIGTLVSMTTNSPHRVTIG